MYIITLVGAGLFNLPCMFISADHTSGPGNINPKHDAQPEQPQGSWPHNYIAALHMRYHASQLLWRSRVRPCLGRQPPEPLQQVLPAPALLPNGLCRSLKPTAHCAHGLLPNLYTAAQQRASAGLANSPALKGRFYKWLLPAGQPVNSRVSSVTGHQS
jgi:hypothetical protein